MQLPETSPVLFWTQIKCSELSEYFQGQWSEHLSLQKDGHLTDITLYLKDGSISLHQTVLVPLSSLLSYYSYSDTPLAILLPDYDLSTAQCLVSLLYSGRCLPQTTATYFSLLAMISSLGINLSPSSLALCSPDHYKHNQGHGGVAFKDILDSPGQILVDNLLSVSGGNNLLSGGRSQPCENDDILSKEENNIKPNIKDKGCREDAKTPVVVLCSDCGLVSCLCTGNVDLNSLGTTARTEAEENTDFQKNMENNLGTQKSDEHSDEFKLSASKTPGQVSGNICPVCGLHLTGGMFKYRAHLVEKHFYKQLSTMLGIRVKQCPICEKTIEMRFNLVKHLGTVHKYVDKLLNGDIYQNSTLNHDEDMENLPKLVINDDQKEEEELPWARRDTCEPQLPSPTNKFTCTICRCSRKSQFRLLQHYSVAHFKTNLEEKFGLQFVANNGCCPFCRKIMKNLNCFLVHIGAAHGEVSQYVKNQDQERGSLEIEPSINTWVCPSETCTSAKFSNKCFLMKHLAVKHYNQQLSAILQPLYETSSTCEACGKKFSKYQRFLIHCSVTHRMVLPYCSQIELDSLKDQGVGRVRRVEGDKSFECKLCKKAFMNNYLLKKHYTAKHFYDALKSDFLPSISSGVCQKCGQEYAGSKMVQHLGVTHDEVVSYVEQLSTDVLEPEVILQCD